MPYDNAIRKAAGSEWFGFTLRNLCVLCASAVKENGKRT